MSQAGLEPIRAGRFFVHTPTHRGAVPDGAIAFEIDAGLAFGTGQHDTTAGCLAALDRLEVAGKQFANIADIGTGTGLLAFAALALWPEAKAIATDIDPISIDVTADNARDQPASRSAMAPGELLLAVADGMDHEMLAARAPFDLLIANILAGPLIELAPGFAKALAPGGSIVLAGLLDTQAEAVIAAYEAEGMTPHRTQPRANGACWYWKNPADIGSAADAVVEPVLRKRVRYAAKTKSNRECKPWPMTTTHPSNGPRSSRPAMAAAVAACSPSCC